jgi:hypothetical protein
LGLDSVELVLALEEEFEVAIDDHDAVELKTPRKVASYIFARLDPVSENRGRCLTQAAFYRVRFVLMEHFGARRNDVRLDSSIQSFLRDDLRQSWRVLRKAIGASHLPGLRSKSHLYFPITLGLPAGAALSILLAGGPLSSAAFVFPVVWLLARGVAAQLGNLVPPTLKTVGSLVPYVGIPKQAEWTEDEVLQRVLQITSVKLGIPLEKIGGDHRFVEDLGLDR